MADTSSSLQFDQAELGDLTGSLCGICKLPLHFEYYQAGSLLACASCRVRLEQQINLPASVGAYVNAMLFGLGASLLGAGLYYGVTKVTGYEIGLVSMAVGLLVGHAVHRGSGRIGGRGFQLIAVVLAYLAMAGSYVPFVVEGVMNSQASADGSDVAAVEGAAVSGADADPSVEAGAASETAASEEAAAETADAPAMSAELANADASGTAEVSPATDASTAGAAESGAAGDLAGVFGLLVGLFLMLPIEVGMASPISALIMLFALWEGWRVNTRPVVVIEGPFAVKSENDAEPAPVRGVASGE